MQLEFYLLAAPVVVMVGVSKGGFGSGLGMLAVPLLALLIDPRLAAAIMLPILCVMDGIGLWSFRGHFDKQNLAILVPGACVGTLAGALTFELANASMVRLLVGVLALYFVIHYLWGRAYLSQLARQPVSRARGSFWGLIAGYVSYIAHAGGPPVAIYLLPQQLAKSTFAGTTIVFFSLINALKLIPYIWLGQITSASFYTSLTLLPLAPLGVWLGIYLHHRVSDATFYRFSYVFLALAGAKLSYEGIQGLLH
jgi:uncharacterized membrane protein YfcA